MYCLQIFVGALPSFNRFHGFPVFISLLSVEVNLYCSKLERSLSLESDSSSYDAYLPTLPFNINFIDFNGREMDREMTGQWNSVEVVVSIS